mgnify:CR=1 FL=1
MAGRQIDVDVFKVQFIEALDAALVLTSFFNPSTISVATSIIRNLLEITLADLTGLKTLCMVNTVESGVGSFERVGNKFEYRNDYYTLLLTCRVGDYFVKARGHLKAAFTHDIAGGYSYYDRIELESLEDLVIEKWSREHWKQLSRSPEGRRKRRLKAVEL